VKALFYPCSPICYRALVFGTLPCFGVSFLETRVKVDCHGSISPYRTVNALRLGYNIQSVMLYVNNDCLFCHQYRSHT